MTKQVKQKRTSMWTKLGMAVGSVALVAAAVVAGSWASGPSGTAQEVAANDKPAGGWGGDMLAAFHNGVIEHAGVEIANACGLGATSCFKCHNKGRRGPEPSMDEAKSPWHPQHMDVNHSCDGCHNGNPRLMVKGMAHRDMVSDPRTKPDKTCATCHESSEISDLLSSYQN